MNFAGVENQAFGKEFIEKVIDKSDRFAFLVNIPYQEFVVQCRDYSLFVGYPEERAGYPVEGM
jgi:hypothetical protein